MEDRLNGLSPAELAAGVLGNLQEVLRAAWGLHATAETETAKLNALRLIAKEESHLIFMLNSLGFGRPLSPGFGEGMGSEALSEDEIKTQVRSLIKDLEAGEGGGAQES
jgi:hypothetical protein